MYFNVAVANVFVLTAWASGAFEPVFIIYAAVLVAMISNITASAYVATKTVDATISVSEGFAFVYRNSTRLGNMLGLWELIAFFMFMGWSMFVTLAAFDSGSYVVDMLGARELAASKGKFGGAATMVDAIKFFALLMVQTIAVWIAGASLGDNADELLDFFNHYDDNTATVDKEDASRPYDQVPSEFDLLFHAITTAGAWVLYTFIMFAGYYFAFYFAKFYPVSETCDLDGFEASKYSGINAALESIPNGSLAECKAQMKTIFDALDLNNDKVLDRCEDAKFLMFANNGDKEYAMNYAGEANLPGLQKYCHSMVIDAFDQPDEGDQFWT